MNARISLRNLLFGTLLLVPCSHAAVAQEPTLDVGDVPAGDLLQWYDSSERGAGEVDFGTDDYTVTAWLRTTTGGPILAKAPLSGEWEPGGKVLYVAADGALVFDVGWVGAVRADANLTDGEEHLVAMRHHADGRIELFADGEVVGGGTLVAETDEYGHRAKAGSCATDFPAPPKFHGKLDGVRFYSRLLDDAELALCFTDHVDTDPNQEPTGELAAYWAVEYLPWFRRRIPQDIRAARRAISYVDSTPEGADPRLAPARARVDELQARSKELLAAAAARDVEDPEQKAAQRAQAMADLLVLREELAAVEATLPLRMPSGPTGPGSFGAYYTDLTYSRAWDDQWRVGDHPDVVVRFDDIADRFVFWRGTSYIPCWVNDADVWYTNEFLERRGGSNETEGCCEPMSDKQCRFSHVRIIESNDARVVVHWRYSPVDVEYRHPYVDELTGWPDWVDEYYTIYPDGVGVRKATIHTSAPGDWTEWQEAIVLNQPGTKPDDNIESGAITLANLAGDSHTYEWTEDGGPAFDANPDGSCIQVINVKGSRRPFAIVNPDEATITPYRGHAPGYRFNFWNHWPVAQEKSWTTVATSEEKPSHTSLSHMTWKHFEKKGNTRTKILLHGTTGGAAEELVPLARSWLHPPRALPDGPLSGGAYDPTQRAYVFDWDATQGRDSAFLLLEGTASTPIVNPAFVIRGWGAADAALTIDTADVERGPGFRVGHHRTIEGTDLIVWLRLESSGRHMLVLSQGS